MPKPGRPDRIGIVLQGRMSSRRLPGKVLMRIGGRTVLGYLVDACRRVHEAAVVCVATSTQACDDPIAACCAELGVACFRGSLDDVAGRFIGAAAAHRLDAIVRISADSPLTHPELITQLIRRYGECADCDLVSNVVRRTYPSGMSVEVIRTQALAGAYPAMTSEEREHVTPYFYAHPDAFRIVSVERTEPLSCCKFSIDTLQDFDHVTALMAGLDKPHWDYSIEALVELSRALSTGGAVP